MKTDVDYIISLMKRFTTTPKSEMGEQDSPPIGNSGGGSAYPSVTKWASGRKFGPTYNPDQKKWNNNGITRGKANTLL